MEEKGRYRIKIVASFAFLPCSPERRGNGGQFAIGVTATRTGIKSCCIALYSIAALLSLFRRSTTQRECKISAGQAAILDCLLRKVFSLNSLDLRCSLDQLPVTADVLHAHLAWIVRAPSQPRIGSKWCGSEGGARTGRHGPFLPSPNLAPSSRTILSWRRANSGQISVGPSVRSMLAVAGLRATSAWELDGRSASLVIL